MVQQLEIWKGSFHFISGGRNGGRRGHPRILGFEVSYNRLCVYIYVCLAFNNISFKFTKDPGAMPAYVAVPGGKEPGPILSGCCSMEEDSVNSSPACTVHKGGSGEVRRFQFSQLCSAGWVWPSIVRTKRAAWAVTTRIFSPLSFTCPSPTPPLSLCTAHTKIVMAKELPEL